MKFEASRAVQTMEQLGDPRFTGPERQARILDFVAEGFRAFRWQTERREDHGLLIARPAANRSAGVRVVFLVPLGAVWPAFLPAARVTVAALWHKAIQGVRLLRSRSETAEASSAAERSGPAFLLELARSWPVSRSERLETICAVAGGQGFGHAGARELFRMFQREWVEKPTLLLLVHGPGIGQELVIQARRHRQLAATAAEDLWIPHRMMTTNPLAALAFHCLFQKTFGDYVALFGGGRIGVKETQIDGAALGRAAQLCTEISLRWARQQRQKPDSPDDRSASSSFQKPG